MILTLKIECVWGLYLTEAWIRVIEIDEEASLYDLHDFLQDVVDFDRDHLFGFYIANRFHGRKQWLSESEHKEDMWADYAEILLKDVFPLGRKKLYYLFDYGDDWTFEVRRSRKRPREPEPGVTYPRVIESIGPNPPQYPETDF